MITCKKMAEVSVPVKEISVEKVREGVKRLCAAGWELHTFSS